MNQFSRLQIVHRWVLENKSIWIGQGIKTIRYLSVSEIPLCLQILIEKAYAENIYSKGTTRIDVAFALSKYIEHVEKL